MTVLDYARSDAPADGAGMLKGAIVCWLGPLILGTLSLIGWIVTHFELFPIFGVLTILVGVAAFGIGMIFLLIYVIMQLSAGHDALNVLLRAGLVAFLLVSNFAVAGGYMTIAQGVHPKIETMD
jgi:hypothetical protein